MSTQTLPDLVKILTRLFDQCGSKEQRIPLAILERLMRTATVPGPRP